MVDQDVYIRAWCCSHITIDLHKGFRMLDNTFYADNYVTLANSTFHPVMIQGLGYTCRSCIIQSATATNARYTVLQDTVPYRP